MGMGRMGRMGRIGQGWSRGGARQVWMGQGWDGMASWDAGAVGQVGGLMFYPLPPTSCSVRLPFLCPQPFPHTSCPCVSPHSTPGMKEPFSGAQVSPKGVEEAVSFPWCLL